MSLKNPQPESLSENPPNEPTSWTLTRFDRVGLSLAAAGMTTTVLMILFGFESASVGGICQPFTLGAQLIALGLTTIVAGDWLELRTAQAELSDFRQGHDRGRPLSYSSGVLTREPQYLSMDSAKEILKKAEERLRTQRYLYVLWPYCFGLMSLAVFGFASGYSALRSGIDDPPPYAVLYRWFSIATLEFIVLGGAALGASIGWNRWIMEWGEEIEKRQQTILAQAAEKSRLGVAIGSNGNGKLNGNGEADGGLQPNGIEQPGAQEEQVWGDNPDPADFG